MYEKITNISKSEQSMISLLLFSLKKDSSKYSPCWIGDYKKNSEVEFYNLMKKNDKWEVSFIERSQRGNISIHSRLYDAIDDFYVRVIDFSGIYQYIEEWEKETGKYIIIN